MHPKVLKKWQTDGPTDERTDKDHWNDVKVFSAKIVIDLKHFQSNFGLFDQFFSISLNGRTDNEKSQKLFA